MIFIAAFLIIVGTFLCVASSIGVARMPDVFCRIHASSVSQTLGAVSLLAAYAAMEGTPGAFAKTAVAISFLVLSSALGGHMLARAAYRTELPMHGGTVRDEWGGRDTPEPKRKLDAPTK